MCFDIMQYWKRQESQLSYKWNTINVDHSEAIRPEFFGNIIKSPVTGKPVKHYPRWKRWLRYGLSFILTLPVLSVAVGAMLCSLNLNGYIKDKESPVYFECLSRFAEPVRTISVVLFLSAILEIHIYIIFESSSPLLAAQVLNYEERSSMWSS